jgi:hypothetical protein
MTLKLGTGEILIQVTLCRESHSPLHFLMSEGDATRTQYKPQTRLELDLSTRRNFKECGEVANHGVKRY